MIVDEYDQYCWLSVLVDRLSEPPFFGHILEPLGTAINTVESRVQLIQKTDLKGYNENFERKLQIFDDGLLVEDLLGAAFVVFQRYVASAIALCAQIDSENSVEGRLKKLPVKPYMYRELGPSCANAQCPAVEAIHSAANYFKHAEEWNRPWSEIEQETPAKFTVTTLRKCKARERSPRVLRDVAIAIGCEKYSDLRVISSAVELWQRKLIATVKDEFSGTRFKI